MDSDKVSRELALLGPYVHLYLEPQELEVHVDEAQEEGQHAVILYSIVLYSPSLKRMCQARGMQET